jgi:hypothetical protein
MCILVPMAISGMAPCTETLVTRFLLGRLCKVQSDIRAYISLTVIADTKLIQPPTVFPLPAVCRFPTNNVVPYCQRYVLLHLRVFQALRCRHRGTQLVGSNCCFVFIGLPTCHSIKYIRKQIAALCFSASFVQLILPHTCAQIDAPSAC